MDADRGDDLNRDEAKRRCSELGTNLVSIDTEDEFEFLKREIRRRVTSAGQEFAHEQWWTAGKVFGDSWVWDKEGKPPGMIRCV